jgi:vacuolar-type H+-ATPase subunit H
MASHTDRKARNTREKTSQELEREVQSTRQSLHETIDELEARLSPGQLVDQAMSYLRSSGPREFARNLGRSVNENPLPVAFAAASFAWLIYASSRSRRHGHAYGYGEPASRGDGHDLSERAASAADRAGRKLAEAREKGREAIRDAGATLSERATRFGDDASEAAERVRDEAAYRARQVRRGVERTLHDEPLLAGMASFAVGAILAAMLPPTRSEDETLGPLRDRTLERTGEIGVEKVREVAERGAEKAREVAERVEGETRDAAEELKRSKAGPPASPAPTGCR